MSDDVLTSPDLVPPRDGNGARLEPKCRVCRHDPIRAKVNQMLAEGFPYMGIFRSLHGENTGLAERDRVSWESVQHHAKRHFPVQNVARATYREILERRARENAIDFVNGVATANTPLAVPEIIMVKGFAHLIDDASENPGRQLRHLRRAWPNGSLTPTIATRDNPRRNCPRTSA